MEGAIPHPLDDLRQPPPNAHRNFTPLLSDTPRSLDLIPMSYSYSNDNFSTAFGPGDFNLHQYPGLESSPGTASELRMNDAFVNSWGRIDQPTPIAGPSMSNPVPTTYGNSHGHNLADQCT